ncbi:MAG: DUF1576 domain-containing protein [Spirochaetaceae bacterium]
MQEYEKPLYLLMAASIAVCVVIGVVSDGLVQSLQGLLLLQQHAGRLINDFTLIGGVGGAMFNAASMGILFLLLVRMSDIRLSGPTIAAVFTIMGFSLFGKTPSNALPIVIGVYLAGRIAGKPFTSYIIIAMFGTALGPLVSFLTYEAGFTGAGALLLGALGGVLAGILLPALSMAMLKFHEGYNIYNIGFASGFLGLFAAALLAASNFDVSIRVIWNDEPYLGLTLLVPIVSLLFIIFGIAVDGKKIFGNLKELLSQTGRLPSDFIEMVSPGSALVNSGALGLAASAYLLIIGADINGPTIGGMLTIMGFATFGKHLKNSWPVAAGVFTATLLFGKSLTAPGPVLALLFGTTLAPIAGEFGILIGFAAGFTHLLIVERTAAWHGGMDLYNNGFAGGLTATLFVAVIEWVEANKKYVPHKGKRLKEVDQ